MSAYFRHSESSSNTKQLASDTELKRGLKENCIAEDTSETKVVDSKYFLKPSVLRLLFENRKYSSYIKTR